MTPNNLDSNLLKHKNRNTFWLVSLSIANVLSLALTIGLMYFVYTINYKSDPSSAITSGYWVAFIFIGLPIVSIIYSFILKIKENRLRYLILLTISTLVFLALFILIIVGVSS